MRGAKPPHTRKVGLHYSLLGPGGERTSQVPYEVFGIPDCDGTPMIARRYFVETIHSLFPTITIMEVSSIHREDIFWLSYSTKASCSSLAQAIEAEYLVLQYDNRVIDRYPLTRAGAWPWTPRPPVDHPTATLGHKVLYFCSTYWLPRARP